MRNFQMLYLTYVPLIPLFSLNYEGPREIEVLLNIWEHN